MPRKIIVGTDFSERAIRAAEVARALARRLGASLEVIHAIEPTALSSYDRDWDSRTRSAAAARLEQLARALGSAGVHVETHLLNAAPDAAIVERAQKIRCELIVVGSHGRHGLERYLLGSVAEAIVRKAPCSVLTVEGGGDAIEPKCVVAAADTSERAAHVVDAAVVLAGPSKARLHLVHAIHVGLPLIDRGELPVPFSVLEVAHAAAERRMNEVLGEIDPSIDVALHIESGVPYEVITERARALSADLIVVGAHAGPRRARWREGFLGSTAERTLRHAPCSVWTVRASSTLISAEI